MTKKEQIDKLVEFRNFILYSTQEDINNNLEGAVRYWLDTVIDDITLEIKKYKKTIDFCWFLLYNKYIKMNERRY